jgi:hypothetical protein
LFNVALTESENFGKLSKIITNKENIQKINDILLKLYRCRKSDEKIAMEINARKFMSAWMLVSFPEEVIGKKKININNENEYPDDIYFISKKMIESFVELPKCKTNNETKRIFFKRFNQFSNAINYFLNRDKTEKIYSLTREYFDICKTLNAVTESKKYSDSQKKECINVINETKDRVMKFLQSFDDSIKREDLELYANLESIKNKKMEEMQYKILIDDIKFKKFIFFEEIIKEIKLNIIKLSGSSNICEGIEDILDVEFLVRNVTYSSLEKNDVEQYGDYLIGIINNLQAPVKVPETNAKWENMGKTADDIDKYLVDMLFLVLEEIREIKETIMNLSAMSAAGMNIFSL